MKNDCRNYNQIKDFLRSYKNLFDKLKSLNEQLEALKVAKESAKLYPLSQMPKSGKQSDLSDYIIKLDVLYTKIIQKRSECENRKLEIENLIADMPDGIEAAVVRKRYIEFKAWEVICVETNYSWAQVHRIHASALKSLNMIHNDTSKNVNIIVCNKPEGVKAHE